MRKVVGIAVGLVCAVSPTACSGSSVADDPPTSTIASSPSTTTPGTTAPTTAPIDEPKPPEMPALAKMESAAGAKAFVQYYLAVLNHSWHAGTGALTRKYSTGDCITCRGIARSVNQMEENGGYYRGGNWSAASEVLVASQPVDMPIVHTALTQSLGEWKRSRDDRLRRLQPFRKYVDIHLIRVAGSWKVTSMVFA